MCLGRGGEGEEEVECMDALLEKGCMLLLLYCYLTSTVITYGHVETVR